MKSNGQSSRLSLDSLRKRLEHYSYSAHERLGSGYSSQVFRGRDDRTGKAVAIKVVNLHRVREKRHEELLLREIKLLQEIKHPNLVGCLDALMTNNNCYIVTDYCEDGDFGVLLNRRERLPINEAIPLLRDVAAGVAHLHSKGVIHRDIKPHNILLHRSRAKLADFGFATRCETSVRDGYKIGSPLYMSPQALIHREYSRKSDVWALGVTFFEVLEGRAPWPAKDENELKQSFNKQIQFKHLYRQDIQELIRGCLTFDREARLTSQQVMIRLQKAIGGSSLLLGCQIKENKENIGNHNNQIQALQESEQSKKGHRSNYNILKWLINYSRFSAKYLSKLQQTALESDIKAPLVELAARCLHMTISKLKRIDQYHGQLGLTHYQSFKRTTKFMKIRAVTEEYHQKFLVMLAKLAYKYSLGNTMIIELPKDMTETLEKLQKSSDQSLLNLLEGCLTLIEANLWAKSYSLNILIQMVNFQQQIEGLDRNDLKRVPSEKILERRKTLLFELREKDGTKIAV